MERNSQQRVPQRARVRGGGHSRGHAIFNGLMLEVNRKVDECLLSRKSIAAIVQIKRARSTRVRALEQQMIC
jgi:hypothetical protein